MPEKNENDYFNEELDNQKENDIDQNYHYNEDEELGSRQEKVKEKKPWMQRFGLEDNLRNKQFSRASRNQPKKEATTLSNILLIFFVILLIVPFTLYLVLDARRSNDNIPGRTAEQVMIARSSVSSTSSEESKKESNESQSEASSKKENESNREVSSQPIVENTPQAPAEPVQPTPPPEPEPSYSSYTVAAGDTWYAIARNHGVDVHELMAANGANEGTILQPGQVVTIPY